MDTEKTVVVFRKWKDTGTIFALFPEVPWNDQGQCMSYEHVGQHGAADYCHCIGLTRPASLEESKFLIKELESRGYNLSIRKKFTRK